MNRWECVPDLSPEELDSQHEGWIDSRYLPPPTEGVISFMVETKGVVVGDEVLTECGKRVKLSMVEEWRR